MNQEAILNTKWTNDTLDKNGKLKPHIRYGTDCAGAVEKGSLFLYIGELADSSRERVMAFAREFMKQESGCHLYIKKSEAEHFPMLNSMIRATNRPERLFAVSETIVAFGNIPNYFRKRPEQKLWFVCDEQLCGKTRDQRAKGLISNFLNSSVIVAMNEEAAGRIRSEYRLDEVFTGKLLAYRGDDDTFVRDLCHAISTAEQADDRESADGEAGERFAVCPLEYGKRKILIYCNWNGRADYREYVSAVLDSIDPDRYDVTLLLYRKVTAFSLAELLDRVALYVRVIYRMNTFSASAEDFIRIQTEMEKAYGYDSAEEYLKNIDEQVLKAEAERLLGTARFDTLLYCGPHDKLWYLIARSIPADVKKKIELETAFMTLSEDEEDKNYRANRIKAGMDELVFDVLVTRSPDLAERYREFFPEEKLPVRVCEPGTNAEDYRGGIALFDGADRYIIPFPAEVSKENVILWEAPGPRDVLVDASRSDAGELLEMLRSELPADARVCVVNGEKYDTERQIKESGMAERVFSLPFRDNYSRRFLPDFCRLYSAYYTTAEDDDSLLGMAMAKAGKPVYLLKNGALQALSGLQDPEEARSARMDALFGI